MTTYDASVADAFIFLQRESGTLLSRMGHDLKLRFETFEINADLDAGELTARFDADSLEPVDAIKWEDKQETGELSAGDRHEIKQRMNKHVLDVERFPDIVFEATRVEPDEEGWHVVGSLDLHGETREIEFDIVRENGRARVETVVDHTDYGIEPYSAMLGSLKVAPELHLRVETPLEDG
ncbi:MAG: YceI family protein [Myxococcota bacterium]